MFINYVCIFLISIIYFYKYKYNIYISAYPRVGVFFFGKNDVSKYHCIGLSEYRVSVSRYLGNITPC